MSEKTEALWKDIEDGNLAGALSKVHRLNDSIEDRMKLASQFEMLIKAIDLVAELVPDNMTIFQLKDTVKYAHDHWLEDQDSRLLVYKILSIGYMHLPNSKVRAAINRDVKAGKRGKDNK